MITIGTRQIGSGHRPYLIAEMSGNHNQSLGRAMEIVDAAADAGADAIKLQTYTADTMTLDVRTPGFVISDPGSLWAGEQLYELYKKAHTPWEWHQPIMDRARSRGLHCFSSPFDDTAVEFLGNLDVPAYKIASFEITDTPLIKSAAGKGKPLIISTGMASLAEIEQAVTVARQAGCPGIVLLKCTSTYPATPENSNLHTIDHLRKAFGCDVGLSDHTLGVGVAAAAVAWGACLVEKHFTLRRSDGGVDSAFSMEPAEFSQLRIETDRAWQAMGGIVYGGTVAEEKSKLFRRSLFVSRFVKSGDRLTHENVRIVRPALGLSPNFMEAVLGRSVSRDCVPGTPITWDLLG